MCLTDALVGCSSELRSYPVERAVRAVLGYGGECCHQPAQLRCGTAHCVATQTARVLSIKYLLRCFSPVSVNHCLCALISGDLVLPLGSVEGCLSCPLSCGSAVAGRLWNHENIWMGLLL